MKVGVTVNHSWRRGRGQLSFWDFVCAENRRDRTGHRPSDDAMGAWVFRMQRCKRNRLPGRDSFGRRVAVDVTVADSCDRAPEGIVILGIKDRDRGVHL